MSEKVFVYDDMLMLTKMIKQLGYEDKKFYVDFSEWDAENKRFRLLSESNSTSVALEEIVGKPAPYEITKHLFVLVSEYKYGEIVITAFDDFAQNVADIVVLRYLNEDEYSNLKFYFVEEFFVNTLDDLVLTPVEFSCILENEEVSLNVENFGEIIDGVVVNRAVDGQGSNKAFKDYLFTVYDEEEKHLVAVEGSLADYSVIEASLSNIVELVSADGTALDSTRYFTSFEGVNLQAAFLNATNKVDLSVIVYDEIIKGAFNGLSFSWDRGADEEAEDYFEFCQDYWRRIYEEGLK